MANSKWQINRIGLIDFWYYDEEEFHFLDGKLLLRGANGSGKSVTMQSFIPLLLDGNKASERLDPFQTKARRIENYLLEENDEREERTGYLYMEFKRAQSDTFFTVGLGLRARKGKKLDSWYFAITDGRRVGKDFFLYKDMGNKVALSKVELKNRLEAGGMLLESQREYMKLVNERLFGYETPEEYKELVDLLIQLRTPKLSKDFKPTVLNEILSNSLQPLSEDDLRPMSEAIENMDNLKSRLEALLQSEKAAGKIFAVYDKYNRSVLREKAKNFLDCRGDAQEAEKEHNRLEEEFSRCLREAQESAALAENLKEELETLTLKKRDLDQNDAAKIREKQVEAEAHLGQLSEKRNSKEGVLEQKKDRRTALSYDLTTRKSEGDMGRLELEQRLMEMGDLVAELAFDEHEFMRAELLEHVTAPYGFSGVKSQVKQLAGRISQGIELFHSAQGREKEYERLQQEAELEQRNQREAQRNLELLVSQQTEVKAEFVELLHQRGKSNQVLRFSQEELRWMTGWVENFDVGSDYQELREYASRIRETFTDARMAEKVLAQHRQTLAAEALGAKEEELARCVAQKEPEPVRSEAVTKNRQALTAAGIPHYPFYRAVDFDGNISPKQANLLEEALLQMGVLDALIVPENYEAQVLALDEGMCDRYLFASSGQVEANLGHLLAVDEGVEDLVLYQSLSNLLVGMGTMSGDLTYIDENGNYGLGVLHGTVTKQYKAKFIGARSREVFRREMILALETQRDALAVALEEASSEVTAALRALECLEAEWSDFPSGVDLCEIVKMKERHIELVERLDGLLKRLSGQIAAEYEALRDIRVEIAGICHKVRLEGKVEVFTAAASSLHDYELKIFELENLHARYLQTCSLAKGLADQIQSVDEDMDDLAYDIGQMEREIRLLTTEIENYGQQLALSNYEQIRFELDFCIRRLGEIPEQRDEAIRQASSLTARSESLQQRRTEVANRWEKLRGSTALLQAGFLAELRLDYVPALAPREAEAGEALAKRVVRFLAEDGARSSQDLLQSLQDQFYKNLSELTEYSLFMKSVFASGLGASVKSGEVSVGSSVELHAESGGGSSTETVDDRFRRQVIYGKYQGRQVEFAALLVNLRQDAALQAELVKDSDRELFEDILSNTISKKIRARIYKSEDWVAKMNGLMNGMNTSSGLSLSLRWKEKRAEEEEQLNTKELVELLKKDAELMVPEEFQKLSVHFQSKVEQARRILAETGNDKSFHGIMKQVLDYRQWFEFQLYYKKAGEDKRELTNNAFFTLSGGEKAMAMYVPLFSAVVAKYQGASPWAPRLISLDEAFAGVDEMNIRDMFRLMVELDFQFIINSQVLWGDYDSVPSLAIYQLLRPENAKFVTVIPYVWNGIKKVAVERIGE